MGYNIFEFKRFIIKDDLCAMKVNTDSIILASWALSVLSNRIPHKNLMSAGASDNKPTVLDIGSGSGLLSLMLAQGFNGHINADAVELDARASEQGHENVIASPWPTAVTSYCEDIINFTHTTHSNKRYDIIITNPPYFPEIVKPSNAYSLQSTTRQVARNQQSLSVNVLIGIIAEILSKDGIGFLVMPSAEHITVHTQALAQGLIISQCLAVKSQQQKAPYVNCYALLKPCLNEVNATPVEFETATTELIIYQPDNVYSSAFRNLCADFYRDF